MKLYRAQEMRLADEMSVAAGVPGQLLMEAAGRAVADSARSNFPCCRRILLLCGKGNNGGDGFVAARYLHLAGASVTVLELPGSGAEGDAAVARTACLAHTPIEPLDLESLKRLLPGHQLVIDALIGSGLTRPLEGEIAEIVEELGAGDLPILSVDVPSGVDADSPLLMGPHLKATVTVQLAGPKIASTFEPARTAFGRQETAEIGIPAKILAGVSQVRLLGNDSSIGIPTRPKGAHKYQVGTLLVLAGSPRYLGAAELACRGAYRAGCGLVTLAAEERLAASWPEIVFHPLRWNEDPVGTVNAVAEQRAKAIVAGPGLDERALEHLPRLLSTRSRPWVLDAGALHASEELRAAVAKHGGCVLTPHVGEAARLLGSDAGAVSADPLRAAARIAAEWNGICVLKGASTVIADPGGSLAVSPLGAPGMATGGSGDVLAGIIGAYLATEGDRLARVEAAVSVHGLAGVLADRAVGDGMLPSDLIERIPFAARELAEDRP